MAFDEGTSNSDFHIAEQVRRKELGENGRKRRTRVRGPHRRADYRGRVGLGSADRQSGAGYRPGRQAALHAGHAPSLWTAPTGRVWAPRKGNSGGQVRSSGVELCRAGRGQCSTTTRHEVEYLGYIIDEWWVHADIAKIQFVRDWPTPNTLRELRNSLGLADIYRRFVLWTRDF